MSTRRADAKEERILQGNSVALSLLTGIRAVTRASDRIYQGMGYTCGALFLLLALFITYQAIVRKLGLFGIMAPGMDQISGYVLGVAATWAFSYALRTGSHVRIDLLLPFMPRPLRFVADLAALAAIGLFASLVAWRLWVLVLQSYELGATTNTYPLTPLWIPQILVAIGFSMLGFTAIQMMVNDLSEAILPRLHGLTHRTNTHEVVPTEAGAAEDPPPGNG